MTLGSGPGYCSPETAMKGPREKICYVTCISPAGLPDYVAVVDLDPESDKFCEVNSLVISKFCCKSLKCTGF